VATATATDYTSGFSETRRALDGRAAFFLVTGQKFAP